MHSMPVNRTCVGCGAAFLVPPSRLKYGPALWCSQPCRYATPGWADSLKPPMERKRARCESCGTAFETPVKEVGRFCSKECVWAANGRHQRRDPSKRMTRTCLECGAPFVKLICLGDRAKFCSRACLGLWTCRHRRIVSPTSIELALEAALALVGVATVREMKHGRFNVDLAIPSARIAIEADGKYWHSLPKQVAADARKDAALAAAGWRVLRFGEDRINEDVASCVAVVLESLGVQP
jgi:very-short-patch-repair endonuclease